MTITAAVGQDLLTVESLSVIYKGTTNITPAVSDVSFSLRAGEILGVIGESGSGKSTVGRAVLGLLPLSGQVSGGSVHFGSDDLLSLDRKGLRKLHGSSLALIPQATASALDPVHRISDQFHRTYKAHGRTDRSVNLIEATRALESVGLRNAAEVLLMYPHELSGGMAQRVVVALAGALEPEILVADEPTSALDVTVQRHLLDNLSLAVREGHRACLLITHDLGVVANYCDRVLVMYDGYSVEEGTVHDVLRKPAHPFTAKLLRSVPGARGPKGLRTARPDQSLLKEMPSGPHCPYLAECGEQSDPRCATEMPTWRDVGNAHRVRTFCATSDISGSSQ